MSDAAQALARLELSDRLRHRRLETLPVTGPGAVFTEIQGRGPGESTRPAALADLISSISGAGVLQPILVEETIHDDGAHRRLVLGERRLRACRWGAAEDPANPHFAGIPAVICPGPLSEEDVRSWQLIENLAREPLQPGELAEALLLERCAMLITRLLGAGIVVPHAAAHHDNAVQRWNALQALRPGAGPAANVGAAWEDVIRRLGLHLTARKARLLVEAFRTLPREISSDMDQHRITLTARCRYAQLYRGREHAARSLWDAIAARGATGLLPAAVAELLTDATLEPESAIDVAAQCAADADARRSDTLTGRTTEAVQPAPAHPGDGAPWQGDDDGQQLREKTTSCDLPAASPWPQAAAPTTLPTATTPVINIDAGGNAALDPGIETAPVEPHRVEAAVTALRALVEDLRAGRRLSRYDTGTLALLVDELRQHADLDAAGPRRGDGRRRGTA
ncbi:MAG: hypothetical protein DLM61_10205 [Pseudonocardiales bacterium]|nr:MAG: hypothetical protein DLM61_10205 [Pseudonocardiales bacterium]